MSELVDRAIEVASEGILPKVWDFCDENSPVHRCIHAVACYRRPCTAGRHILPFLCHQTHRGDDGSLSGRLQLDQNELELIEHCIQEMESETDFDRNEALADMRYTFIEKWSPIQS